MSGDTYPMDPGELIEAAALDFSSLPLDKKHLFVTDTICRSQNYHYHRVRFPRQRAKGFKWIPFLYFEELMTMLGLNEEDAKAAYKEPYYCHPFEVRLLKKGNEEYARKGFLEKSWESPPSSYSEEIFVDTKFKEYDDDHKKPRHKLCVEERKNMLAKVGSYRKKIEWGMENRKKTEFSQSDDDDGERAEPKIAKEILKKKEKSVSTNKATLRYSCMDGKIVHVDPRCCYESDRVLHDLIETERAEKDDWLTSEWLVEEGDIGRFSIIAKIPSHILEMVNDFCISRFDIVEAYDDNHLLSEMLEVFDCSFAQKHKLTLLVQLMHAASVLKIKSLLELTRNAIVDRLDGKSAEEIHMIFNMPDFTHEAWVQPLTRDTWALKQMMVVDTRLANVELNQSDAGDQKEILVDPSEEEESGG